MQYALITVACSLMSIAVMAIAATSLAINCYNDRGKKDTTDYKFFIANLVITILFLLISFGCIYLAFSGQKVQSQFPQIISR
jgi:uncharacterized membrane protein YbhN (UPF0104 family)